METEGDLILRIPQDEFLLISQDEWSSIYRKIKNDIKKFQEISEKGAEITIRILEDIEKPKHQ